LETNVESGGIGPAPIAHHRHALGLHVQNVMYLFEVRASDRLKKPVILLREKRKLRKRPMFTLANTCNRKRDLFST
jgi:hypothetical protein